MCIIVLRKLQELQVLRCNCHMITYGVMQKFCIKNSITTMKISKEKSNTTMENYKYFIYFFIKNVSQM